MKTKDLIIIMACVLGIGAIALAASTIFTEDGRSLTIACALGLISLETFLFIYGNGCILADGIGWFWIGSVVWLAILCWLVDICCQGFFHFDLKHYSPSWFALIGPLTFFAGYVAWWLKIGRKVNHPFGRYLLG